MITVDKAKEIILNEIRSRVETESVSISRSLGRVSAIDVRARENIPPFDNSAMDGFAVKAKDVRGASRENPKILEVIEDVPAGYIAKKTVRPNQAIRIMTGAPLPKGANSVVMVEWTKKIKNQKSKIKNKEFIEILRGVKRGENVRRAGEDIRKGDIVIKKGEVVKGGHVGVLASLGYTKIRVARRPRVAILATGDELVSVGSMLQPGKIRNSNTYSLYSQVLGSGATPVIKGIARDRRSELAKKIGQGIREDMLLVSGGISVGAYDFVKDVLHDLGVRMKFWKVAMRPGKPLAFGMIGKTPVFGLPGNPVSSMVSYEIFVRPAIQKMLSHREAAEEDVDAELEEKIEKKIGFRYFLRAVTRWKDGSYFTKTTGPQSSGILRSMALANSLMILPESSSDIEKGEKVKVRFLNRNYD